MMFRKAVVLTFVISLLVIGAVAVYAQGGSGRGPGTPINPADPTCCVTDPLANAYNHGGSFQGGAGRGAQQRGQMNRGAGQNGTGLYATLPPATEGELPQEIVDLMIQGWLDEQHAYAVYDAIMAQFGEAAPFVNIQQAEAQHSAAWEFLFERYGIPVPAVPEFDTPIFASLQESCALGAEAEIANFGLYDEMLAAFAGYPDIYQVAQSLRNASEFQHLPAFQMCAAS